jgi:fumarate hydratase, class I
VVFLIDPKTGNITKWQYGKKTETQTGGGTQHSSLGEAIVLNTPISKEDVRKLKVGDVVLINGKMHTGRDNLHKYLIDHDSPVDLNGGIIYHCGPVMIRDADGNWRVHAAGPTTSSREEPYQATIIKKFGIRAVVGKAAWAKKPSKL